MSGIPCGWNMPAAAKLYAGVKLREIRARLKLTQADYAAKLGVSLSYLSQMENNHRPVSAGVLRRLASEFSVDVGALAAGEDDEPFGRFAAVGKGADGLQKSIQRL